MPNRVPVKDQNEHMVIFARLHFRVEAWIKPPMFQIMNRAVMILNRYILLKYLLFYHFSLKACLKNLTWLSINFLLINQFI